MGGAVSSGRDNNELVDNLMCGSYIRSRAVERVFRVLDRADYMSAEARDQAYKDLAWRNGPLHLSAPCIYSEVMEALELKPGLSFLNVGSGTGYLSTLVGLIIGSSGTSHGVEALPVVFEYANKKLSQFIENSVTLDEFDFCMPKYYTANGLCLAPTHSYDRVYCGAGVLSKYENYFKQFIKVGGVLVMPLADTLVQLRRVSDTHWAKRNLLNVSFALLRDPDKSELEDLVKLDEQSPAPLQILSRRAIRDAMRAGLMRRHPELREPPAPPPPAARAGPRRICIPYDAAADELNELHDLDEAGGAHEMNALLSLVLSMGQNRAAGSLRLDPPDDEDLGEEYAEVGGLYTLDEGEEEGEAPLAPLPPPGGVIVLDVSRAPRRPRTRLHEAPPPAAPAAPAPAAASDSEAGARTAPTDSADQPAGASTASPRADRTPKSLVRIPRTRALTRVSDRRAPLRSSIPRPPWTDSSSEDEDATQVKESKRQKLDSGIGEGTASSGASPDKSRGTSGTDSSRTGDDDDDQDTDMPWCDDDDADSGTSGSSDESDGDVDSDGDDEGGDDGHDGDGGDDRDAGGDVKDVDMEGGKDKRTELKRKNTDGRRTRRGASRAELRKRMPGGAVWTVLSRRPRRSEVRSRSSGTDSGVEAEGGPSSRGAGPPSRGAGGPPPPRRPTQHARETRRVRLSLAMKRGIKELPLPHALKKFVNYGRCYQF